MQPILKRDILGWKKAIVNVACRLEYVDWNVGKFKSSDTNIGDDLWSIVPAISFRPTSQTVLRFNYRYQQQKDILANLPVKQEVLVLALVLIFKIGYCYKYFYPSFVK